MDRETERKRDRERREGKGEGEGTLVCLKMSILLLNHQRLVPDFYFNTSLMRFRVMNLIPKFEKRGLKLGLSQKIEVECKKRGFAVQLLPRLVHSDCV